MDCLARRLFTASFFLGLVLFTGCATYTQNGALMGGLGGAGLGAIVGNAVGAPGAGAAIGAGFGSVGGAVVGNGLDNIEARNRAAIEQHMHQQVSTGAVTIDDAVAMSRAGVAEELIVTHIRAHGVARPLQAADLIFLQQQGVSANVIAVMQQPPAAPVAPMAVAVPQPVYMAPAPGPMVIEEHYYHRPYRYGPPPCPGPRPHVGVGVSWHD